MIRKVLRRLTSLHFSPPGDFQIRRETQLFVCSPRFDPEAGPSTGYYAMALINSPQEFDPHANHYIYTFPAPAAAALLGVGPSGHFAARLAMTPHTAIDLRRGAGGGVELHFRLEDERGTRTAAELRLDPGEFGDLQDYLRFSLPYAMGWTAMTDAVRAEYAVDEVDWDKHPNDPPPMVEVPNPADPAAPTVDLGATYLLQMRDNIRLEEQKLRLIGTELDENLLKFPPEALAAMKANVVESLKSLKQSEKMAADQIALLQLPDTQ